MNGMILYYISRAVISAAFGLLFALAGSDWRMAALIGLLLFAFFVWAPRSGRYALHPGLGITALRRDERAQSINDKSARNAFVVTMLVIAGIAIYFGLVAPATVPVGILDLVLALGFGVYLISDFWLRRT